MLEIKFPYKVCSDYAGYQFLTNLYYETKDVLFTDILLDFSKTSWHEANLCAVLGAVLNDAQNRVNNILITNLSEKISDVFSRNHFLASFQGTVLPDNNNTTIRYRKNKLTEEKLIKEFLFSELVKKQNFPKLSEAAQKEIIRSIFEIYSNAIIHGNTEFVYSCGQFYPSKDPPRIDFTIVDLGNTIKNNVNDFLSSNMNGIEAIEWAVLEKNSTKSIKENIPGGLGFKLICDFVKLNKGKVQIVSSDGYWEQKKEVITKKSLDNEFPGTLVNIEFNMDDSSFYYLTSENVDDIIF